MSDKENLKDYTVVFTGRVVYLYVTVKAENEEEAIEFAEDIMTFEFTSEDENTECTIQHTSYDSIEKMDFEKEKN